MMDRSEGRKRAITFSIAVFAVTYLATYVWHRLGGRLIDRPGFALFAVLYMWFPALTAIALQKLVYKEGIFAPLGVSFKINKWWLAGWVIPPIAMYLAFGFSLLMPHASLSPDMTGILSRFGDMLLPDQVKQIEQQIRALPPYFGWVILFAGVFPSMIAGATVNAAAAFGEELGWRGFLQKSLAYMGFWKSSFVIGIIWGFWHAPLIIQGYNYPQHPLAGVFMMTALTMLLAPIFAYVTVRGGSVVIAAIAHGTFNAVAGLALLLVRGGSDLTVGVTGLAGLISLALINIAIYFYDRRKGASA